MSTYLPWLLRPTGEGAQGGAPSAIQAVPVAYVDSANSFTWNFIVFHVNQVIQPLFSTNFPTTLFFPNLSLYF